MVPGYEIIEQLHTGAHSDVLRARRDADGQMVVLKAFKPVFPDPQRIARFEREFEIQSRLRIDGVPRARELIDHQGQHVLVMSDSGAQSVRRVLATEDPGLLERLRLCIQLVDVLEQVHAASVIHKDINPANTIWDREHGRVEIIDFGTATLLSREEPTILGGTALEGTLAYMAPEQTGRVNSMLDYRADYYALGSTFYEILTGSPPFRAEDPLALIHCHIARTPVAPAELTPGLPAPLSRLVMKLLEKSADRRYQSTFGIRADLQRIADELERDGTCSDFALGRRDVSAKLLLPQKLYGRADEQARLLSAFERSRSPSGDDVGLVLVAGSSGIGKSALVYDLVEPITVGRGHFIAGKYEQFGRNTPYSAIVRAFQGLVRELLSSGDEALERWTGALRKALGQSGRVITDVIPEVELLLGPQPEVQEVEPNEARARFNLLLHRFIQVFARPEHPLVLFLDDLQWADLASLALIEELASGDRPTSLLVIGAYRDHEVGPQHPLAKLIARLEADDAEIETIVLQPLESAEVTALVADALDESPEHVAPLASLVHRNTEGNPLFVRELLQVLFDGELIRIDPAQGRWRWDLEEIQHKGATENILDLMVDKIRQLPRDTQATLRLAAGVGSTFELRILAALLERTPNEIFESLLPAIDSGVLLMSSAFAPVDAAGVPNRRARFFHDRVQQGAYALVAEGERPAMHARIGRLMMDAAGDERGERVFEIVDQLNRGTSAITKGEARLELARLNLEAGLRARASAAFDAAADYLRMSWQLLPDDRWQRHYELSVDVCTELALVEFFVGDHEASDRLTRLVLERARTNIEKAEAHGIMARCATMIGRYADSLMAIRSGLALLDVELPSPDADEETMSEAVRLGAEQVRAELGDTDPLALLDHPTMSERRTILASEMILNGVSSAFYVDRGLYCLLILRFVSLALEHGHPPSGSSVYGFYAHLLATMFDQPRLGDGFGRLALELSQRQSSPRDACSTAFMMGNYVHHWVGPMSEIREINRAGFEAGIESGELQFAGYILTYEALCDLFSGMPLAGIRDQLREHLAFSQRTNNTMASDAVLGYLVAVANLSGETDGPDDFRAGELDEATMLAEAGERGSVIGLAIYPVLKTMNCVIHRRPEASLAAAAQAEALQAVVTGAYATAQHVFRRALAHALAAETASNDEQRVEHLAAVEGGVEQLSKWAEDCPENFAHMHALLEAEAHRLRKREVEALAAYDRAVVLADDHGYPHDAALAEEQLGRLWLQRGKLEVGHGYLKQAYGRYRSWGAGHKLTLLEQEFEWLLEAPLRVESTPLTTSTEDSTRLGSSTGFDLASVIKASQAISSEIVGQRLSQRLMEIVLENAGAQRGVLVLDDRGELRVEVVARVGEGPAVFEVDASRSTPLADYDGVPHSVIVFAARTGENVLLNDSPTDSNFARDPYFVDHRPESILCVPLVNKGTTIGLLYLENGLVTGAFTAKRLELLRLLSSQFVISFENASLYDELEQRVERRTRQLAAKNEELEATLSNLARTQARLLHAEKMASLGRLTAGVAHEINNPLNFVNNFAEVGVQLLEELDETSSEEESAELLEDIKSNITLIRKHGMRAAGIVTSMLQHARGQVGQREATDLNRLVRDYVALADFGAESTTPVELRLDDDVGSAQMVPQEIARVLVNLLNNAHHAVRQRVQHGDEPYSPRISVETHRRGDRVEVVVQDNGVGIPEDVRGRIFEPFFTTKSGTEGTGLGLSVCYDIVVQGHGGTIDLASEVGHGTTFTIRLG